MSGGLPGLPKLLWEASGPPGSLGFRLVYVPTASTKAQFEATMGPDAMGGQCWLSIARVVERFGPEVVFDELAAALAKEKV